MPVKNANAELPLKNGNKVSSESWTMSPLSSALQGPSRPLENSQDGFSVLPPAGSSYAEIATIGSPKQKTAFGERAIEEYAKKAAKIRPSLLPVEAIIEGIKAMEYGAQKYGPHQWKEVDMSREEFMDALERHLLALKQGETHAPDSGVHHLGHIIANCGIILSKFQG